MPKHNNIGIYPIKENPVSEDYFLIADSEDNLKTKNVKIGKVNSYGSSYKRYKGIISQNLTADPNVTVFENGLGAIVWTRIAQGQYIGTLVGAFTNGKTFTMIKSCDDSGEDVLFAIKRYTDDTVIISSSLRSTLIPTDSLLNNIEFYIDVYSVIPSVSS